MKKFRILTGAALVAALAILAPVGTAQAAQSPQLTSSTAAKATGVTYGLSVTGFDAKVAKAHGYTVSQEGNKITVTKSGVSHTIALNNAAASPKTVAPPPNVAEYYNSATADCGTAWIGFDTIGDKQAVVTSGFTISLVPDVAEYYWNLAVTDADGVGSKYYDNLNAVIGGHYWDNGTGWDTYHTVTGYAYDTIAPGWAILTDGSVCTAATISAYDYLY